MNMHAGLVALRLDGYWRGALILGSSGAGKSDLALRALDAGFRLIADDRVTVWASGGALWGRAPEPLAGLIEARGCGIVAEPALAFAEIAIAAQCAPPGAPVERMPDPALVEVAGFALPSVGIDPFEASAPAKLRRALQHLGASPQQGYQARSCGGGDRLGRRGYPLRPHR
ncbi:MAG TPA: HPr kinase/phosphorylase [Caulobacteraceae bacterium]|nr:HPr kinase/phosphorylase [Caulobacteraceae bacterium]